MIGLMGVSGFTAIVSKIALRDVSPLYFVWLSLLLGLPVLVMTLAVSRGLGGFGERARGWKQGHWLRLAAIGLLSFGAVRWLFLSGLERLPATTQAFLVNLVGVTTMAMSAALLRETPARRQVLGALIVLGGVCVFFRELPRADALDGIFYVLAGVVALAAVNVLTRGLVRSPATALRVGDLTLTTLAIGAIPIVIYGITQGYATREVSPEVLGAAILNATIAIAFGPLVFNRILKVLRAYEASVLAATAIIWVGILAIPMLGERLQSHQLGGIAVMLGGMILSQWRPRQELKPGAP